MTPDQRNTPRTASFAAARTVHGLVATLNVAFMAAAFLFSVLALVLAVKDHDVLELGCALCLLVAGGLLIPFLPRAEREPD